MKTLRPLKNRRLAHAVRNHTGANGFAAQIGIVLQQCFHTDKLPDPACFLKPVLETTPLLFGMLYRLNAVGKIVKRELRKQGEVERGVSL